MLHNRTKVERQKKNRDSAKIPVNFFFKTLLIFNFQLILLDAILIKGTLINGSNFFYNSMVTEFPTGKAVTGTDELLVQLRMQGAIPSEVSQFFF